MPPSLVPASQVDSDIALVRGQIQSLERRRSALCSVLLSSQHTLARLQRAKAEAPAADSPAATALAVAEKQRKLNLENLHRTCAGITAFRVKDPDPYALDDGKVLGVRIEVSVKGRFVPPYYLLLNRPSPGSETLRIHKHTIPPCIPLQALAATHLPQTPVAAEDASTQLPRSQDLHRLVRELRRELVSHHLRLDAIAKLRRDAGLPEVAEDDGFDGRKPGKAGLVDVKALGVDGREIQIGWADKSTARILLSKRGVVEKVVVRSGGGVARKRDVERKIMGGDGRVEGVVERLIQR